MINNKQIIIGTDQNLAIYFDLTNFSYGLIPTITRRARVTHSSATVMGNVYTSSMKMHNINSQILVTYISGTFPIGIPVGPNFPETKLK